MNLLGCLLTTFVIMCVMCALFVGAFIVVIGTIMMISKLIIWMAYLGAAFILLGILALLFNKLFSRG